MNDFSLIDSNFKIDSKLAEDDIKSYDVKQSPFKIYGVFYESGRFRRIPEKLAKTVNDGVFFLHTNTAGGRVCFKTDSPYIAIHALMPDILKMSHFALTGSSGFDLYIRNSSERYFQTFVPPFDIQNGYESVVHFDSSEMRDIVINFPLYSNVSELYIGVSENSYIHQAEPYKIEKPIVYYGSSITQGGCASRPGMSYESIISRRFNADYINLGFSGSAKGENKIAEYISNLEMSAFIYDYDYNAPTSEHLNITHEKMFRIIREANPDLPIIILSRPKYYLTNDEEVRFEIIKNTYNNAVKSGDKNVYIIDGRTLMDMAGNEGTVDSCHPNDLGFMSMAKAIGDVLKKIFAL